MKKILLAACALCLCTVGIVKAQSVTTLTYSLGFGTGDVKEFISQTSFRGVGLEFNHMVQDNIGVGFMAGWNVFYDELPYDTYTAGKQSLSGKQWRYSNHVPLLATANYFLKPGENVNPFVGLGIGTIYTRRNTDMNLYTIEEDAWMFGLSPTIGAQIMASDVTKFNVSLRYNAAIAAGDFDEAQNYLSLNIGFAFGN
jgi:outer membrane protein